jgi:hypothetical protein
MTEFVPCHAANVALQGPRVIAAKRPKIRHDALTKLAIAEGVPGYGGDHRACMGATAPASLKPQPLSPQLLRAERRVQLHFDYSDGIRPHDREVWFGSIVSARPEDQTRVRRQPRIPEETSENRAKATVHGQVAEKAEHGGRHEILGARKIISQDELADLPSSLSS